MNKKELQNIFKHLSFIDLDTHLLYDDLEYYDKGAETSIQFNSIDEVLASEEVMNKINKITFNFLSGGRGVNYGQMGGGFGGNSKSGTSKSLHPAYMNTGSRRHDQETMIKKFIQKFGGADREYAVAIDEFGYAHKYVRGQKHSVRIGSNMKNHTVVHNHPGGGNFSSTDLLNTASNKNRKGIVATNGKTAYRFEKTSNFKSKEFSKAVENAKWPKKYDYDKGADWWLKRNAKKYGYKYSHE